MKTKIASAIASTAVVAAGLGAVYFVAPSFQPATHGQTAAISASIASPAALTATPMPTPSASSAPTATPAPTAPGASPQAPQPIAPVQLAAPTAQPTAQPAPTVQPTPTPVCPPAGSTLVDHSGTGEWSSPTFSGLAGCAVTMTLTEGACKQAQLGTYDYNYVFGATDGTNYGGGASLADCGASKSSTWTVDKAFGPINFYVHSSYPQQPATWAWRYVVTT